ncbi:MAG: bifunctional diaminohydroxyphosphoribosylaminopyrimidine deaminase/5-amino-6-(5-phosphoribosylamino)uracil reductase RibD [Armatimonadetes bacterium]|nr:bifunctional diaminohydroxyphosphoribosylaminopyrimidine deaminase/5-amino-6-(5-phosphoribosylamino)uracil reductase RibD [Armatimonadota bacterium]
MSPRSCLRRALELAERGRGRTSPNPIVGCVVVRDGEVVAEAWHTALGEAHAERAALAAAGDRARGATLYCSLEPCCHHGRTPPCTDAILAAGIAEVHFALTDPDARVAGRGAALLRQAGVKVRRGLLAAAAARQLEAYLHHRRTGRPFVVAKWAMTLDGKLATASGDSRWVSGPQARAMLHRLRDRVDAVLVGAGTVLADDPALTCRLAEMEAVARPTRNPLRVVVDTHGRTPAAARVFTDGLAPTLLAVGESAGRVERGGTEVLRLPEREGRVDLGCLLDELGRRGVVELLCEAGGRLSGSLLREGLVQRVLAVVAPKLAGGAGPTPWDGEGVGQMADALRLGNVEVTRAGDDVILSAYVASG